MSELPLQRRFGRRPNRRTQLLALAAGFVLLAGFAAVPAFAVHDDGLFELDRNAVDDSGQPPASQGEDWQNVCPTTTPQGSVACLGDHTADATMFKTDAANASIFTGGSTKDDLDVTGWLHKTGSSPDKDDLAHGYAARYGDHLYFGADRYSASGDSVMGIWFFQSDVAPITSGADAGTFSGAHINGDVLVLADFTQGGGAVTARVFRWHSPGGSVDGTLDLISGTNPPSPKDCVGPPQVPLGDDACATVNTTTVDSPWAFKAKEHGAPNGKFPAGHFFEGGIDLTALHLSGECFSSVLLESRASQSTDSVLKDFVQGSFENCGATLATDNHTTTPLTLGQSITDTATVTVSGTGTPPAPTGNVLFYVCGPSANQSTCDNTGNQFSTKSLVTDVTASPPDYSVTSAAYTPTIAGKYCFFATWGGDSNYPNGASATEFANECFTVSPNQPGIVTQVSVTTPVSPGTAVSDTATISNLATPSAGTGGTIRFDAYGPNDATCATSVYHSIVSNVTANKDYNSFTDGDGGAFAPTAPGTYRWIAAYTPGAGDVNNLSASTSCTDATESFVVQQFNPALSTAQTVTIKDTVKLTAGGGGGNLTGTLHVELFTDNQCTVPADPAFSQDFIVNDPSGTEFTTNTYTLTDPGAPSLYWQTSFDSTNPAQTDIAASCVENSSLVIDDGA